MKKNTQGEIWEGPEHRSFCPCGDGTHSPLRVVMFTAGTVSKPPTTGISMEASSRDGPDRSSAPSPAPFPLPREEGAGLKTPGF